MREFNIPTQAELDAEMEQIRETQRKLNERKRAVKAEQEWQTKNKARIDARALELIASEWSKNGQKDGLAIVGDFRAQAAAQLRAEGREATAKARETAQQAGQEQAQ